MSWGTIALLTLGGALLFEGLGWALAPDGMKRAYEDAIARLGKRELTQVGGLCAAMGLLLIVIGVRLHG